MHSTENPTLRSQNASPQIENLNFKKVTVSLKWS